MNILFLSPYFPPEIGSDQRQLHELTKRMKERGHGVTVLTGFPNFPSGIILPEYRGRLFMRERVDGIDVVRTWIYATPSRRSLARLANYLSFAISAIVASLRLRRRVDIVFTISPPLFDGIAAYTIGRLRGIPYVFEVNDLWPGTPRELGMLKEGLTLSMAEALEGFIYHQAGRIIYVVNGHKEHLVKRGISEERIHYLPLGADIKTFSPSISGDGFRKTHGLEGKFVVMYAGSHSVSQGLETAIEAAKLLRQQEDIAFVFVGEGLEKPRLMDMAQANSLVNVKFVAAQPHEVMPKVIRAGDVHIVPLRRLPLFKWARPGKMCEIMSCGRPIVLGIEGEAANLIEEAKAGLCVEPENPVALAEGILRLYRSQPLARLLGRNGRQYAVENFDYDNRVGKFERVLYQAIGEGVT